jgi:hypothetical protein
VKSARPSATALRTFGPMKSALCRKFRVSFGSMYGAVPSVSRWTICVSASSCPRAASASESVCGSAQPLPMNTRLPRGCSRTACSGVTMRLRVPFLLSRVMLLCGRCITSAASRQRPIAPFTAGVAAERSQPSNFGAHSLADLLAIWRRILNFWILPVTVIGNSSTTIQ